MRDHPVVIYEYKDRHPDSGDHAIFLILPLIGAGIMWTYWLQLEVVRVWSRPFDHFGYTVFITVLALIVGGAVLALLAFLALVAYRIAKSVLTFAVRASIVIASLFMLPARFVFRVLKKVANT